MSDFIENKLKKISVTELENVIAKAISEATGDEFEATISTINYKESGWTSATFNIKVSKPLKFGLNA